jgi:predicted glycoside hydrolase/deacetylase ChbG (UPF0249 family)
MRRLIVNADDFGLSAGVNRGILEAHDHGVVTSTSLMVLQPAAEQAVAAASERPALSVGLHVDVGEWVYVRDEWRPVYERLAAADERIAREQVERQIDRFHELTGSKPTHLDSHQHANRREPLRSAVLAAGEALRVPVRHESEIRYCGAFYGQTAEGEPLAEAISVANLLRVVETLPEGTTELACHPGYADDVATSYREERANEIASLCHPSVRAALDERGVVLASFAERKATT